MQKPVHSTSLPVPQNLKELIDNTYYDYDNTREIDKCYAKSLIGVLKKSNFWPSLQVKKFRNNGDLLLLHNTYLRDNIESYKELYTQCRSIVLDFSSRNKDNNMVVTYANSIPVRSTYDVYEKMMDDNDKYYEAYDGTTITCYYYNNEWNFGTTSCPNINSSRFSHPTKTHGIMFDEVLLEMFPALITEEELKDGYNLNISKKLRESFTNNLVKELTYVFVLVHSENIHILDYVEQLGEKYKKLVHIDSKNINTYEDMNISEQPLGYLGIKYALQFNNCEEANIYINNNCNNSYGYIVKRKTAGRDCIMKISSENINYREDTDPCNPNVWYNILAVYMKNRIDFHINDYIETYVTNIEKLYDNNGNEIDPTYLIHTCISTIKDVLFKLYIATTTYNKNKNTFRMNKELDKQFPPIFRFHLAKLRRRQIETYKSLINTRDVYYYLCHCIRPNDIKSIINLLSSTTGYEITERSMLCLVTLNRLL